MVTCAACLGPYSPVTGHAWTARVVLCGPCARDWLRWLKAQLGRGAHRGGHALRPSPGVPVLPVTT